MTDVRIRPLADHDIDAVVEFSLRAWEPVFASFRSVLGPTVFARTWPDWRSAQAEAVAEACRSPHAWVADLDGAPVGFVTLVFHGPGPSEPNAGELEMVAVDPAQQRRGIGAALVEFGVERLREAGVPLAIIATGGDPGHAPARRVYERAGFIGFPQMRYYRAL
ncbi:GNAT family N-acetyltransferase [Cryptosporangium aurantiacum]|uniref:Ribosomal protein S18 acetylase RimI n=1 Tax=Cryptosporangium aurantiacum TaxID=134849 RepID=A0A1M7RMS0_9ACTN|nr:GNAT family N-acetyltransferase [Cryptosporangium aurantiacum]SHN47480.1 Ribosomal protein S18 acetylase RimI [Cryptosporangium aurantiacum]